MPVGKLMKSFESTWDILKVRMSKFSTLSFHINLKVDRGAIELSQMPKMELFLWIVNKGEPLTIVGKSYIWDIWLGNTSCYILVRDFFQGVNILLKYYLIVLDYEQFSTSPSFGADKSFVLNQPDDSALEYKLKQWIC